MKAGREHRVPLSTKVLAMLERLCVVRSGPFVFPGQRHGNLLSPRALEMVLHRMKIEGVTVHGFRSAFRDWCGETTSFPRELAEAALAHVSGRCDRAGLQARRRLGKAAQAHGSMGGLLRAEGGLECRSFGE
jgi:integrase